MGQTIWSLWANYVSMSGAFALFALGTLSCFYPLGTFEPIRPFLDPAFQPVPIWQMLLVFSALFILALEWPLKPVKSALGGLGNNYMFRAIFYPLVGVMAILNNQTVNPGLYLNIAGFMYIKAVMNGEYDMKLPGARK